MCCLLQDMTYLNLARYLDEYRGKFPVFSDDIQGAIFVTLVYKYVDDISMYFSQCKIAVGSFSSLSFRTLWQTSCVMMPPSMDAPLSAYCCMPVVGMAAVVLGGVMAAQPLTGRSLAQHTYMFAGEVRRSLFEARHVAHQHTSAEERANVPEHSLQPEHIEGDEPYMCTGARGDGDGGDDGDGHRAGDGRDHR